MYAASIFGLEGFDRDVSIRVSRVVKVERTSSINEWILGAAVKSKKKGIAERLMNFITDLGCKKLTAKSDALQRHVVWFNEEYETFCQRIVDGPTVPTQHFIEKIRDSRKSTQHLVAVCRNNIKKLSGLKFIEPRLLQVFDNLTSVSLAMDEQLKRYEDTAVAARESEAALLWTYELRAQTERSLANFNEDDPLMADPEIKAAALAAAQRMEARRQMPVTN